MLLHIPLGLVEVELVHNLVLSMVYQEPARQDKEILVVKEQTELLTTHPVAEVAVQVRLVPIQLVLLRVVEETD